MISKVYSIVEPGKLDNILIETRKSGRIDFLSSKVFLFLKPPIKEDVLPVLSMKGDLNKEDLSILMALFKLDKLKLPAAIGFRFETPHGDGLHNYHHAQMIKAFDKSIRSELPQIPPCLPETQPALMLSATNPRSLFLGVLIGLYGLGKIEREWQGQGFTGHLTEDLDALKRGCGAPEK